MVTPFFLVFLRDGLDQLESKFDGNSDIIPTDGIQVETLPLELRNSIEADSFWCLTVVLDGIQDNYTFAQPGIQVMIYEYLVGLLTYRESLNNVIFGTKENLRYSNPRYSSTVVMLNLKTALFKD